MNYDECWDNSLNKYLAIMDTRTDYIPALVEEIVEPADRECEGNDWLIVSTSFEGRQTWQ